MRPQSFTVERTVRAHIFFAKYCDNLRQSLCDFTAPEIYGVIKSVMEAQGIKMGPVATPLRVLVCGADKVPQIDKTLELFGKQTVLARIEEGLKKAGF